MKQFLKRVFPLFFGKRGYDLAKPSRHMDNHFAGVSNADADSLIGDSLDVLRNRCRYEVRNNTYAKGIVETLANDIVGTGPKLQLKTPDERFNAVVEERWQAWSEQCDAAGRQDLADLLRLTVMQLCESGEAFVHLFDAAAGGSEVALRLLMIEPDRINSPMGFVNDPALIQGVRMDAVGRPVSYYVQKIHPGSTALSGFGLNDYDAVPADRMIHLARIDRPGQTRGVPWLTPAIPLFGQLRRYTLAVVTAAEKAAELSAVLESDAPVGEAQAVEEFETLDIERGSMVTLPAGWRLNQFKPEQPVDTYPTFKHEVINEIARCVSMPYNVAAANSSSYNYASGRLDWQVYYRHIAVIRRWLAKHLLDRLLALFLAELVLADSDLAAAPAVGRNLVDWYWPGAEHVDPAKEANAQDVHLKNYSTTYAAEYAKQGKDWRVEFAQEAVEKKVMQELGITPEDVNHEENQEKDDAQDDAADGDADERSRVRVVR